MKTLYELKRSQEDSVQSLQTLIDGIWKNFHALKALNQPVDQWDALLSHLILTKLDSKSRGEVEKAAPSDRLQMFQELMKTLENHVRILEAVSSAESHKPKGKTDKSSKSLVAIGSTQCSICKNDHSVHKCKSFLDLLPQRRLEPVRKHFLCINCLASSHTRQDCKAGNCRICHKRHHTLLHISANTKSAVNVDQSNQQAPQDTSSSTNATTTLNVIKETQVKSIRACLSNQSEFSMKPVLLASAIVTVYDNCGREYLARALLDSCSQVCFMTERLHQLLHLKGNRGHFKLSGISCTKATIYTSVNIKSWVSDFKASAEFLVTDKITGDLPQQEIKIDVARIPNYVQLADPHFNVPNKIDLLIGAELFWDLLTGETLSLHSDQLKLYGTHLGFIVSGKLSPSQRLQSNVSLSCTMEDVHEEVHRFWEQENLPKKNSLSQEELECEQHYQAHTKRESDGRYVVSLPLKSNIQDLSDTREAALRHFLRLEKRLQGDPEIEQMYQDFMKDYINMQHAELVGCKEKLQFYTPHYYVPRPDSSTTKLRVVFNASFRVDPKLSFNDIVKVDPTIQSDLFSLILRFRKYPYGLTADLSKMYRQIKINNDQRALQSIWWRNKETGAISIN